MDLINLLFPSIIEALLLIINHTKYTQLIKLGSAMAMKTLLLLCLVICGFVNQGFAQLSEDRKNEIFLNTGVRAGFTKDLAFSPTEYAIGGILLEVGYQRYLKFGGQLNFNASITAAGITDASTNAKDADNKQSSVSLSYLKPLKFDLNGWKPMLGVAWNYYSYQNEFSDPATLNASLSYVNYHGLEPRFALVKQTSRNQFSLNLSIPLVMYTGRSPFNGYNEHYGEEGASISIKHGKWRSIKDVYAPNIALHLKHSMSRKYNLNLGYAMSYVQTGITEKMANWQNTVVIGIAYKF